MGLHPSDILIGYEKASKKAIELFDEQTCYTLQDIHNNVEVEMCMKAAIASKQYGLEDLLCKLVA